MKRFMFWLTMLAIASTSASAGTTFDFVVAPLGTNLTFKFQVDGAIGFDIDWGDGATNLAVLAGLQSHTYTAAGTYTNRVRGTARRIAFGATGATPQLLKDIVSRMSDGVTGINSALDMFHGATAITAFTQTDWFDAASSGIFGTMRSMFHDASAFNQDISEWDVSKITSMESVFNGAKAFNQDISKWDMSKITGTWGMFANTTNFNQDISGWVVSNVITMTSMFNGAKSFNQDLSAWDVSKVTDMGHMFRGASVFNGDIGDWDVGQVKDMTYMFYDATKFNRNIGDWDVSKVENMGAMFYLAKAFNQDIGRWDVSKVTLMNQMFRQASLFNGDIGRWDVSHVTDMYQMFGFITSFRQDISRWNVSAVKNFGSFLADGANSGLPTDYYNQLLIRWSRLPLQPNANFHGGLFSKYDTGLPAECRALMIQKFGGASVTFTDGGSTGKPYSMPATVLSIR